MRKIVWTIVFLIFVFPNHVFSQISFGSFAGNDTSILCTTNCFTLKTSVPDIRSTDDYKVQAVPYKPFPYITAATALKLSCPDQDDKFFNVSSLNFPFCFYGLTYNSLVINTNGVVSFDLSNALQVSFWSLENGNAAPLPSDGYGIPRIADCPDAVEDDVLYPRACIMGPFHDIDIDNPSGPSPKKMEFRLEGTAPFRRAVISFNAIPLFVDNCDDSYATHEIVLYESFSFIDVYIKDKPFCPNWNDGNAILGIQNWDRDKGISPPGHNKSKWGSKDMNEAWRFIPDGVNTMLDKVELLQNGVVIATGVTGLLNNGFYDIDFPNTCPVNTIESYTVRAYYKTCNAVTYYIEDEIAVTKNAGTKASVAIVDAVCTTGGNGTVAINPAGAGYDYSKDGGINWQSNNVFTLPPGPYAFTVRDIASGCISDTITAIAGFSPVIANGTQTNLVCNGDPTGRIILNPIGSTGPYNFSKDGGIIYQTGNEFKGLAAGAHLIIVKDGAGCMYDTSFVLTQPSLLMASATVKDATCNGNDGVITITATGGTPAYQYSVNNGTIFQAGKSFTVPPADYNAMLVKDANGCEEPVTPVTVALDDTMRLTLAQDTTVCSGSAVVLQPQTNSQANIFNWTPSTGLNNVAIKNPSASPLIPTLYTLVAKWGMCERTASVNVNILMKPVAHAGNDTAVCNATAAFLHGSATNLSGTVNYAWSPAGSVEPANNAAAAASPSTSQLYTLTVTDNYGCNFTVTDDILVTVQPPVPAFAGNDTNAIIGQPHQLTGSGGVKYFWTPAAPLNDPASSIPLAILFGDTRFSLQVTDIAGCVGTDEIFIKIYKGPDYYIPNAFTPNGDALNDVFRPVPVGIAQTYWFRVFNRYGQLIFETSKFMEGWNGTFRGIRQPEGSYVWMLKGIDVNGKLIEKKGTVILSR